MAEAREFRILDLLAEFLADALILLCPFQTAGAITAGSLQALPDHPDHFFIVIQSDCHILSFLPFPC